MHVTATPNPVVGLDGMRGRVSTDISRGLLALAPVGGAATAQRTLPALHVFAPSGAGPLPMSNGPEGSIRSPLL